MAKLAKYKSEEILVFNDTIVQLDAIQFMLKCPDCISEINQLREYDNIIFADSIIFKHNGKCDYYSNILEFINDLYKDGRAYCILDIFRNKLNFLEIKYTVIDHKYLTRHKLDLILKNNK